MIRRPRCFCSHAWARMPTERDNTNSSVSSNTIERYDVSSAASSTTLTAIDEWNVNDKVVTGTNLGLEGITYGHYGEGCIHLRVGFGLDRPGGKELVVAARVRGPQPKRQHRREPADEEAEADPAGHTKIDMTLPVIGPGRKDANKIKAFIEAAKSVV